MTTTKTHVTAKVPVASVYPNPNQPRRRRNAEADETLRLSIARHGILQPIAVCRHPELSDAYLAITGHRRLEAARKLEFVEVPALILQGDPSTVALLEIALQENVIRKQMCFEDIADAVLEIVRVEKIPLREAAERLGLSQGFASKCVAATNGLAEDVKTKLTEAGHGIAYAYTLAQVRDHGKQRELLERCLAEQWDCKKLAQRAASYRETRTRLISIAVPSGNHASLEIRAVVNDGYGGVQAMLLSFFRALRKAERNGIPFLLLPDVLKNVTE